MYLIALRIAASPPQATRRSKYCARNSAPSTSGSPPRQYTHENDCVTGWSGSTLRHRPQDRGAGEQVVRRQLEEVHALGERAAGDRAPGDAGRVAGEHVDEARAESADRGARVRGGRGSPSSRRARLGPPPGRPGTTATRGRRCAPWPRRPCVRMRGRARCTRRSARARTAGARSSSSSSRSPTATRKSMISASGRSNAGPGSLRGQISSSRSSLGVVKSLYSV